MNNKNLRLMSRVYDAPGFWGGQKGLKKCALYRTRAYTATDVAQKRTTITYLLLRGKYSLEALKSAVYWNVKGFSNTVKRQLYDVQLYDNFSRTTIFFRSRAQKSIQLYDD